MSTANPQPAAPTPPPPRPARREVVVISHSTLFYWWPVWVIGFVLAIITWFTGDRVALVPEKSDVFQAAKGEIKEGNLVTPDGPKKALLEIEKQDVLVGPKARDEKHEPPQVT